MNRAKKALTEKQVALLNLLFRKSEPMRVFTVTETQSELSRELGITRQALNIHLRKLKEEGYLRTGRGFIDLTEKALELLGVKKGDAFIAIKVEPQRRLEAYERIKELPVERIHRVTGDIDLIVQLSQAQLDEILNHIANIKGVKETRTYIVIESLK